MTPGEIRSRRLTNQQLQDPHHTDPAAVVGSMAAIQSQEYAMALWAVGLRTKGRVTETDIAAAFDSGQILRTHTMRPTWHFIANDDIRWMLDITAPRVISANKSMYQKFGLDIKIFSKSFDVIQRALEGGNYLTRDEIKAELLSKGLGGDAMHMVYVMMHAELLGIVCSGPRKGRQFTYALIDERAPKAKTLAKDEALRELCQRYFATRGPASIKDFANWSGLAVKDAREGIGMLGSELEHMTIDGVEYYFCGDKPAHRKKANFLMPDYDEYGGSYKNRDVLVGPGRIGLAAQFNRTVIVDGVIAGTWRRTLKKGRVLIELQMFPPHQATDRAVEEAVRDYGAFLGLQTDIIS